MSSLEGWAFHRALGRAYTPVTWAIYLFAILVIVISNGEVWSEAYAFGRSLTPLVLLAALDGLSIRSPFPALSVLAIDPRIGLQWGGQILHVAHGLIGK